ncbi:hypothetical protein Pyn_13395 [Prunus yedoensis var. nudiflora]|uniref:Uncharacterized protein n=1 Tax=Prunus yedoensis var. nudiflora TaxID=2094558 RepID=A0A314UB57_PRUYE|nr:hypothetical protein Pyn_13395 [Prunus yedoensis var. nudiflora]
MHQEKERNWGFWEEKTAHGTPLSSGGEWVPSNEEGTTGSSSTWAPSQRLAVDGLCPISLPHSV